LPCNAHSRPTSEYVSASFRQIFKENPELLKAATNDDVYRRWLDDHPGDEEGPTWVTQILSFVKSALRKKRRKKRAYVKAGSPVAEAVPPAVEPMSSAASTATRDSESLE
jgi:hypothetical protein